MSLTEDLRQAEKQAIKSLFGQDVPAAQLMINDTKPEFEGDYTLVMFPLTRVSRLSAAETAGTVGRWLAENHPGLVKNYNVVKGFLNITVADDYYTRFLSGNYELLAKSHPAPNGKKVMIEYSSPNTNKPLHLGHLRNNFLGYSLSLILEAGGYEVIKANLVNDRGIHICKSMVAWLHFGQGATPESTGVKGDHLVGDYYVKFNEAYKAEVKKVEAAGASPEQAEKDAPILKEAQELLLKWEQGDPEVRRLWAEMNGWVYRGFEETYRRMWVSI
jgi:arginyl-tRNA synthetase